MYINPIAFGVISTLVVEMVLLIGVAVITMWRNK